MRDIYTACAGDKDELLESVKKNNQKSGGKPEVIERKDKFIENAVEASTLYPLSFFAGNFGAKVSADEEDAMRVNPDDKGLQAIFLDRDWLDARIGEFCLAGKTPTEAKKLAGECAFTSFLGVFRDLLDDLCTTSQDWGVPEKHPIELLVVMLMMAITDARRQGIPASVVKAWTVPAMVATLDSSDVEEIFGKLKQSGDSKAMDVFDRLRKQVEDEEE